MPIASTDILFKFSVLTGAAGNATAGTAAGSLGKYISTTQITDNTVHNLFDVIAGDENAASESEYRCFFIHNNHATLSFDNVKIYLFSEVAGGASLALAVDDTAESAIGASAAQARQVADENTAPAVLTFSSPTTLSSALSLGNIPAGHCKAVWVRRTAANSAGMSNDGGVIRIQGESL